MSKLIVLEGPDRCGKATQSTALVELIRSMGLRAALVEIPVDDNLTYPVIYWMLRNGIAKKFPKLFQCLQFLNRKIFQTFKLPKLEKENDFIVMDRWSLSTVIYGIAEGVPRQFTEDLYYKLRIPDHTVLLLGKSHMSDAEDSYEADSALQERVRSYYADWAQMHPTISSVVDCSLPRNEVSRNIQKSLHRAGLFLKTS